MSKGENSYAAAGVDIEAGDAFVRQIAPLVAATARAGSRPDLRGFAGVFDLKACGYRDPLLLSETDGVVDTSIDGAADGTAVVGH